MRAWVLSFAVVLIGGCNAVLGLDPRPSRDDVSGGGDGGTGNTQLGAGGSSCEGADCFAPPPVGWQGPLLVSRGEDPIACDVTSGTEVFVGYAGLSDLTHSCPCTCEPATGVTCTITVNAFEDQNCMVLDQTEVFTSAGDCRHLDRDPQSTTYVPTANTGAASCAAAVAEPVIPDVTWSTAARGCTVGSDVDAIPQGFDACVQKDGDVPCPDDFYTERTLLFEGVEDTRACMTDCTCGAVTTTDCGAFVQSFTGHTCNENVHETPPAPGCAFAFFDSTRLVSLNPTGTCEPNDATATGAATPTGALTVCCAP